jgi:hypothetical protein
MLGLFTPSAIAQGTKPDIYGSASKVKAADDGNKKGIVGSMLVVKPKDANYAYDKAVVYITVKTRIQKQNGKLVEEAKFQDIREGMRVSVWFDAGVDDSDPVQATAVKVLIFP